MPRKTSPAKNLPRKQLVLSPGLRILTNGEDIVYLPKQTCDVLLCLAATPQELVSYEELFALMYKEKKEPRCGARVAFGSARAKLRKLLREKKFPNLLETVWGEGVYLAEPLVIEELLDLPASLANRYYKRAIERASRAQASEGPKL